MKNSENGGTACRRRRVNASHARVCSVHKLFVGNFCHIVWLLRPNLFFEKIRKCGNGVEIYLTNFPMRDTMFCALESSMLLLIDALTSTRHKACSYPAFTVKVLMSTRHKHKKRKTRPAPFMSDAISG